MSGAEAVYERAFAAQWLADSKRLIRERWSSADCLGTEWEQLGLYRHTPVALSWGDFLGGRFAGALNGRAGSHQIQQIRQAERQGICRSLKRPCRFPLCSAGGGDATAQ